MERLAITVQHVDSVEGTVVNCDADEFDDWSHYFGATSKSTQTTESLAVDRASYGRDVSYAGPSHLAALEIDIGVDGLNPSKRSAMESFRN